MINKSEITQDWLRQVSRQHQNVDKILVEKVVRALLVLEGLAKKGPKFIFKGGTALMLHFNSTKRLSIDIDIVFLDEIENLDSILNEIAEEQGFIRKEIQHRTTGLKIKKEHYKFFFLPSHKTQNDEEYILLDILFENVSYRYVNALPIQSCFAPQEGKPITVMVPSLEDLMGDKLTAFAPNTTGIPYYKRGESMSMEIIKQLYDIGNLFDLVNDIEIIASTFYCFVKTEVHYRNLISISGNDVLEDIYQTALCIVARGGDGIGNFIELQKGVQRVRSYIFSENYHIEKAIVHASKAAYISILIKVKANKIEKFDNPLEMNSWQISGSVNSNLNKLKKSNPEAFFYWFKICELKKHE
jgi:predicted nucleotidyltransferase component of viral defense system